MMYQTPGLEKQQDGPKAVGTRKKHDGFWPDLVVVFGSPFSFPAFSAPPSEYCRFMPHSESNFVDIYLHNMALHSPQQHNSRNKRNKL